MADVAVSIPNVYLSDLERLAQKVHDITGQEDTEITFEFIIASLFPTSWTNIQNELKHQYTKGYIQGRLDKEQEMRSYIYSNQDDNSDCYCE